MQGKKLELTMTVGKETKGTDVFYEDEEGSGVPSLYVQKIASRQLLGKPSKLKVTIEAVD
jgi:hypothetical protein